ncbi:MAG: hypothetical protein CTY36_00035 [Methylocystis sp.]|nr:MAG: hypothetical protein CTY36_00035 [Methylocystis sp.]
MTDWKAVILATVPPERRTRVRVEIVAMVADHADELFARYGFTTIRRQASIIGHMAVESTYFSTLRENLNYRTAGALMRAWPKRFRTEASCVGFLGNPVALANKVYNGRMGNRPGTDDGWINRGAGLLQQTGADNLIALAKQMGVSVEKIRAMLVSPDYALECACVAYLMHAPLSLADAGDVDRETKAINGGYNGLAARKKAIAAATRALAAQARLRATQSAATGASAQENDGEEDRALRPITEAELAAAGSRIIKGAKSATTDLVIKAATVAGAGAVVADESASQPPQTIHAQVVRAAETADTISNTIESASQALTGVEPALQWAHAHWHSLALMMLAAVFVVFSIRNYLALKRIKAARVEDEALGLNIGRL